MAIFIKSNGKITMAYPYDELNFTSSEAKVLLTGTETGTVKVSVLMKPNKPVLRVWYNYESKINSTTLNKKGTLISESYGQKKLYGDVLIEGDVEAVLDELKIVFPYIKLPPTKRIKII